MVMNTEGKDLGELGVQLAALKQQLSKHQPSGSTQDSTLDSSASVGASIAEANLARAKAAPSP
eukprot:4190642-Lingulodinium_polyedra.AAC.1